MSVFHRVDDLDSSSALRAVPLMVRLPVYDGAVRFALRNVNEDREASAGESAEPVRALSADQLQAMNTNPLYGPMAGQAVGMFDVVKVPA